MTNNFEEKEFEYDMYRCYDRTGEGVMFEYKIKYDWQSIVDNDVNAENFIVEPIGFVGMNLRYLESIDANINAWIETAMHSLTSDNQQHAQECFFDSLPNEIYNQYSDKRGW